jgi:hypothetical protein
MTNEITQKLIDLLGPITDGRLHFSKYKQEPNPGGYNVIEMSKVQRELTEEILKEHFKFKEVRWMQIPGQMTDDGEKAIVARTFKLEDSDYETYEGKTGYVYMVMFTPKMYDLTTFAKSPVKDGCTFGPLVYNPENFEPYRTITITYNPTYPQDIDNPEKENSEEVMKQQLRDKLEKILEDPDAFMPEAFRGSIIRMAIV